MEYIIVPMDRGHIPQIAALERECFSTPWSENMLSDALFDPKASFIVAEDGEGGVLGYALAGPLTRWLPSRETLDQAAEVFRQLYELAHTDPEAMRTAPHNAQIGRPDEVQAARNPILRWQA